MSEFYQFSGTYVRLAGNSPTELGTATVAIQAAGNNPKFTYEIDQLVTNELPFVTLDGNFLDTFAKVGFSFFDPVLDSARPNDALEWSARLGQIEWGSGLSSTVLSIDGTAGVITIRYAVTLDGDPIPMLSSTGALEYNAFLRSVTSYGPATGEFAPGQTIRLKDLDGVDNSDPSGTFISGQFNQEDTITGTIGTDTLIGSALNETISGLSSDDTISGQGGDDVLDGGRGDDRIAGGSGADTLIGGAGRDTLIGGIGKDSLEGGAGRDVMNGGGGADVFIFADGDGKNRIKKFDTGKRGDSIDLSDVSAIRNFNDLTANHMEQKNANVVITDGSGLKITLTKTDLGDLDSGDFLF